MPTEQDTSQTLQRDSLKQRERRNPRVTYRIVHELEKVLLEVVFGGCPELGVLLYVGGSSKEIVGTPGLCGL